MGDIALGLHAVRITEKFSGPERRRRVVSHRVGPIRENARSDSIFPPRLIWSCSIGIGHSLEGGICLIIATLKMPSLWPCPPIELSMAEAKC
jgi:hypothetical protein